MYNINWLDWTCNCGNVPLTVEVGTTCDGYLIGRWACPKCKTWITARMALEKLIANLPMPAEVTETSFTWNEADILLLKGMHISED